MNSLILSKTFEEGSCIKKLIFFNNGSAIKNPKFHISFSSNSLTIDCPTIDRNFLFNYLKYLKILLELWPGLILRLKNLKNCSFNKLNCIQSLLIYCLGSPLCCKLFFSKVVINIDIDEINIEFFKNLDKLKLLYDSLSKIYAVELKNITYEDLLNNNGSYFKKFIERQRDEFNNEKLKFERALKYSRIECCLDDFLNNTNDGFNQAIAELKLKEFEFYADKIHMDRKTYDNLKKSYEHFGQFRYSDQRDQGEIKTYENRYGDYCVRIVSRIKENNSYFLRSITVYESGEIVEEESSNCSTFHRKRIIYKSGFCEEYSIDRVTLFAIRKVVYPDAQQFTNEVYVYDYTWKRGWSAIGDETYAIQNKSIPYLLGDNQMKEYKFVSEDGLLNIIDLRRNENKEFELKLKRVKC